MNEMFQSLTRIYGITHIRTIPYSKEENGIVERANKEVNRHLRNIIFDSHITSDWSDYLPLIEKLFNSSIKSPLGVSPNHIIFGNIIDTNNGFLSNIDEYIQENPGQSIQKYITKLLLQQQQVIAAANKSLQSINNDNQRQSKLNKLQKQYKSKSKSSTKLDQHQHFLSHEYKIPSSSSHPAYTPTTAEIDEYLSNPTIVNCFKMITSSKDKPAVKWILNPHLSQHPDEIGQWVKKDSQEPPLIHNPTTDQLHLTKHAIGDYVLRKHPTSKAGHGPPNKYGTFWRGPYLVLATDNISAYTIQNLVTGTTSEAHLMHLKPFYYDPDYVTPINIAAKDNNEFVIESILDHGEDEGNNMLWKIRWQGYDESEDTWEPYQNLKDVELFHNYCLSIPSLHRYLPQHLKPKNRKRKVSDMDIEES
jgi:hypothetical protein